LRVFYVVGTDDSFYFPRICAFRESTVFPPFIYVSVIGSTFLSILFLLHRWSHETNTRRKNIYLPSSIPNRPAPGPGPVRTSPAGPARPRAHPGSAPLTPRPSTQRPQHLPTQARLMAGSRDGVRSRIDPHRGQSPHRDKSRSADTISTLAPHRCAAFKVVPLEVQVPSFGPNFFCLSVRPQRNQFFLPGDVTAYNPFFGSE